MTLGVIFKEISNRGGHSYYVGGCVRDSILGIESKDIDIEVHNISIEDLENALARYGQVDLIGKSFGILKFKSNSCEAEFSIPRTEEKVGAAHKGFEISLDPNMGLHKAVMRRDFTINAIMRDCVTHQVIDPVGGIKDLRDRILRPVSDKSFEEDPLRLLRGFQFAARFGMYPSFEMVAYEMPKGVVKDLWALPKSRIWGEWYKWATKGKHYSLSLQYMCKIGMFNSGLFSQIGNLEKLHQDPEWHPEGDALVHTGLVLEHAHKLCVARNITDYERCVIIFAALCHDFGKATTTTVEDNGRITAKNHAAAGLEPTKRFLNSIECPISIKAKVLPLVAEHMVCASSPLSDTAVRKLSKRVSPASIRELCLLIESDQCGRYPRPQVRSDILNKLQESAKVLGVYKNPPAPIMTGNDILSLGVEQGPHVGRVLNKLYEMQLKGSFFDRERGLILARGLIKDPTV